MKKIIYSIAFIAATGMTLTVLKSSSNGAPGSYTNSPISQGNCSNCHGGGNITLDEGLELTGLPTDGYNAGETYELTLSITNPSGSNGFQISCLDSDDNNAGEFTAGAGARSQGGAATEASLTHSGPNGDGEWTFEWTAPQENAGNLTFYAVGNATQGTGTNPGDRVYGKTFPLQPSTETFVAEHQLSEFNLYPNPVENLFFVEHQYENNLPYTIFDATGKLVLQGQLTASRNPIDASPLKSGIYFFKSENKVVRFVKK